MTDTTDRASGPDRFDQIEALLKSYADSSLLDLLTCKMQHE